MNYRQQVIGVNTIVPLKNGGYSRYVNFDNAATTPPLKNVVQAVQNFLPYYSSIHRGMGYKSQFSTKVYEKCREILAEYLNFNFNEYSVIFTKNTTESINKLSNMLYYKNKDYIILTTEMEHHSNDLPWRKFKNLDVIKVDSKGFLILEDLEYKLKKNMGKVKLVAVTGASNVTGYKNSIYDIAKMCHMYGAKILVDAAQLMPHSKINVNKSEEEKIDFLVFSAHKMYAPFGTGVLIAEKDEIKDIPPDYKGGGTVDLVTRNFVKWGETPEKDEAGTPNVIGAVALIAAINTFNQLDMNNIEKYERFLINYAIDKISLIDGIKIYSSLNKNVDRVAVLPFTVEGIKHEKVSELLSYNFGIGVRDGCFCAHPYIQKLLKVDEKEINNSIREGIHKNGTVRISFGMYNTMNEIDYFCYALNKIIKDNRA